LPEEKDTLSSKFLLDENVPMKVREFLNSKGFSAEYVPKGIVNSEGASLAREEKCALLTRDTDFLNSDMFPPNEFYGIVVFLIHPPKPERLVKATALLLEKVKDFKNKVFAVGEGWLKVIEE
jgi:hypothetical protein